MWLFHSHSQSEFKYSLLYACFHLLVHRGNPQNPNEAILVMGDTAGNVNAFVFSSTSIALFDRPHQSNSDGQGNCFTEYILEINNVQLSIPIVLKKDNVKADNMP